MRRALAFRCVTIALAVSAVFIALLAVRTPFLEQLNLRLLDIKFRLRGTSPSGGGAVSTRADTCVVPCSRIALPLSPRCLPVNATIVPSGDSTGWRSWPGNDVSAR